MAKTKFGTLDKSGKETITHEIDLSKVKSSDPLAYAYGKVQGERGEKISKATRGDKLAPEYIRGYKEGHAVYKNKLRKMS